MTDTLTQQQRRRERRLFLWDLWNQGYSLRECVQRTAQAFGCSERLCYYDWEQRHYWLCKEEVLGSLDQFYIEHLAGLRATLRQTQAQLHQLMASKNASVQVGCLKLIRQLHLDLLTQGQKLLRYLNRDGDSRMFDRPARNPFWTRDPEPFNDEE